MPTHRPPQPETPARDAFTIHRARVADDMQLAYLREGVGGYDFMVEPFEDARRLAAGWAPYQLEWGRPMSEPPLIV